MATVENRPNIGVNAIPNQRPEIASQLLELVKKVSWVVWVLIAAATVVLSVVVSAWLGIAVGVVSVLTALAIANCKLQPIPIEHPREPIREEEPERGHLLEGPERRAILAHAAERAEPIEEEDAFDAIAIRHDAAAWKRDYEANGGNVEEQRRMNAELGTQTLESIEHGFVVDGRVIHLEKNPEHRARVIQNTVELEQAPGDAPQQVLVENLTTLQMTERLIQQGLNPLVADFANKRDVGGDFIGGARAQEETLCRESDLYPRLDAIRDQYPIPEEGGILIPQVQFFRKDPSDGYAFMQPIRADVYAVAFYNCNRGHGDGYDKPDGVQEYMRGTRDKIRGILRTAMANGNNALVLGAGGCGAFRNDPRMIADLFRTELNRAEFRNRFQVVAFAIIDDHNVRPGRPSNFQTFRHIIVDGG